MGQRSFGGFLGLLPALPGSPPCHPGWDCVLDQASADCLTTALSIIPPHVPPKTSAYMKRPCSPLPCLLSGLGAGSVSQATDSRSEFLVLCPPPSWTFPFYPPFPLGWELPPTSSVSQTTWPWSSRYQDSDVLQNLQGRAHESVRALVPQSGGQGQGISRGIHVVQSHWDHGLKSSSTKGTSSRAFSLPTPTLGGTSSYDLGWRSFFTASATLPQPSTWFPTTSPTSAASHCFSAPEDTIHPSRSYSTFSTTSNLSAKSAFSVILQIPL